MHSNRLASCHTPCGNIAGDVVSTAGLSDLRHLRIDCAMAIDAVVKCDYASDKE